MTATSGTTPTIDPDLSALARAYGVATDYVDQVGRPRDVAPATIRAVLAAMGVDASSAQACSSALRRLRDQRWQRMLPPSIVLRRKSADPDPWQTWLHAPVGAGIRLWIELEDGGRRFDVSQVGESGETGRADGRVVTQLIYRIPADLPLGWHSLVADVDGETTTCTLVVAPERIGVQAADPGRQRWGVAAQLYAVRSHRSWGVGDLVDLADLASWFGLEHAADFILINPLHAAHLGAQMEPSPYLPVTRRFFNPVYLRIEAITEFSYLSQADMDAVQALAARARAQLNTESLINRATAWQLKDEALRLIFAVPRTPGRQARFDVYRAAQGVGLAQYALWCALAARYGPHWNEWPAELQDCDSPQVEVFAREHASEVEYFAWLQWLVDEQLACAQIDSVRAGMSIGIMHDLAVGVHRFGADTWMEKDVSARDVTVGAPPDSFNQIGQDWSQPPRRPDRLAETGYASYRDMLRTLFRHCGAVRIDHVLGLFRQWWIPAGMTPAQGTYVRYDHHAMVDILVLEADRAGVLVVGEDLGTVEPWVHGFLADRGILGTTILWFERRDGEPIEPQKWRRGAMAAVTVHDLPPTLGYLAGDHVALRDELGLLTESGDIEWGNHRQEVASWRAALERNSLLRPGSSDADMLVALHRYLTWSPASLLSVSLPDLVGQRATQNQPGTTDEYPNWRVPLADAAGELVYLEDLPGLDGLKRVVAAIGGRAKR